MKTCVALWIALLTGVFITAFPSAAQTRRERNYQPLTDLLLKSDQTPNFVALTGFEGHFEETVHAASLKYLNGHSELIQRIRDDLGSAEIQWRLESLSHRLLYAPEKRQEVASLFADYCRDAIEDVLARTGLNNPFSNISTPDGEIPNLIGGPGVRAIIVQDLAREYIARYQFSGAARKRIALNLSGRIPVNEVGSYASSLHYSERACAWEFTRDMHTIWKCTSTNPYTALMAPLEETLHIALREHTEKAILKMIEKEGKNLSPADLQKAVDGWLAVEEAIVGGLVYKLVPDVVLTRIPSLSTTWIEDDLETKAQFDKYRLLPRGIALVEQNGIEHSIHLFVRDPAAFRALLGGPG